MVRRLAAILAADIVGYSSQMAEDEARMLEGLRRFRGEILHPAVAGHRGKIVKNMGDGWLVEFATAVDAVTCAMRLQDRLVEHPVIRLRVGIHIGDVVHEEEDIFGDAVNVAARLEALAGPGAVVISDAVRGALDGTLRPSFDDEGERRLKNIDRPVRIWARGGGIAGDGRNEDGTAIALLEIVPVQVSDQRAEVRELADALTNDLYTYLGHMYHTRAAVTETPYANNWVLRPVLRSRGDRLRLEILLTAPDQIQRWTRRYDGDLSDSFAWQDETALDAAGYLHGVIMDETRRRLDGKPLEMLSGPEAVVLGRMKGTDPGRDLEGADRLFRHAQSVAPKLAAAYLDAVILYYMIVVSGVTDICKLWEGDVDQWHARALQLVGDERRQRMALAFISHVKEPDPERLRRAVSNALRTGPFDTAILNVAGVASIYLGDPETAEECSRKAMAFTEPSRHTPSVVNGLAFGALMTGRHEEALEHARRALAIRKDFPPALRVFASASAHLGRTDEAREAMVALENRCPGETIAGVRKRSGWVDNEYTRRYFSGLRLAGMPEGDD